MNKKGILIVVSAPSGCGKGTILAEILKDDSFYYSVSATTRSPRRGETDGIQYRFITKEEFEKNISDGKMLEYAQYCGNYYGTVRSDIETKLAEGKNVILEIEVKGAMQIKNICPEAIFVFIVPPSVKELRRRLHKRGTETDEVIEKRIAEASGEIKYAHDYDYIIVNGELSDAIDDFRMIIRAEQLKTVRSENIINEVLENA
jgi:guanylate kinase